MVDAGSGGTRIFVFNWKPTLNHLKIDPIDANYSLALKPSKISHLSSTSQVLRRLSQLKSKWTNILNLSSNLQSRKFHQTVMLPLAFILKLPQVKQIFLAHVQFLGLRMMTKEESESILTKVGVTFSNSKFLFQNATKVISGIEEGLFNWLTINALHSKLGAPSHETVFPFFLFPF